MTIHMTARKVDRLNSLRRTEEQRVSDLLKYSNDFQRLSTAVRNEAKVSEIRREHFVTTMMNENIERQQRQKHQDDKINEMMLKEEAKKLEQKKLQEERVQDKIEREIQRILETSEELKELERNLKVAYVNKERAAQHEEAKLLRSIEDARQNEIENEMELGRQKLMQKELEKEHMRRKDLVDQKEVLQKQMQDNEVCSFILFSTPQVCTRERILIQYCID